MDRLGRLRGLPRRGHVPDPREHLLVHPDGRLSARHYFEDAHSGAGYRDEPNPTPTAVAVFPQDFRTIRACAQRANNIVRYTEFDRGGHFAYTTDPDLVVGDVREFFASLA